MLIRYSSSVGVGTVVTATLIYWMQLMIGNGAYQPSHGTRVVLLPPRRIASPPPRPDRPLRPEPPAPLEGPPDTVEITFTDHPTTGPGVPGGYATPPEPPDPPERTGGRSGPWAADTDLVPAARVRPVYPYSALIQGQEGYVIVEFTVTRRGSVEDARVVESTHRVFESAALAAVARTRYRPRVVDGLTVAVPGQRTRLEFRLDD
jgi:periplasmic protein TonB